MNYKSLVFILLFITSAIISNAQKYQQRISILGDSYSTFIDYCLPDSNEIWYFRTPNKKNDVTDVKQTWWHQLIQQNGYKLCVNNSFSGATICTTGYRKEDYSNRSFISRMKYLGDPDIILIFGGTNDSWAGSPIGEYKYADWTKDDCKSFRPAMAYMLDYVTTRYINTKIYFILNSELKDEINSSVMSLCDRYGVPVIRLHDIDKIASHPSVKGMKDIAKQVAAAIR